MRLMTLVERFGVAAFFYAAASLLIFDIGDVVNHVGFTAFIYFVKLLMDIILGGVGLLLAHDETQAYEAVGSCGITKVRMYTLITSYLALVGIGHLLGVLSVKGVYSFLYLVALLVELALVGLAGYFMYQSGGGVEIRARRNTPPPSSPSPSASSSDVDIHE